MDYEYTGISLLSTFIDRDGEDSEREMLANCTHHIIPSTMVITTKP